MRKLAVLHFNAIEQYPPVMNWLNFLTGAAGEDIQVRVYTMRPANGSWLFEPGTDRILVSRPAVSGKKGGMAYLHYLAFYLKTLLALIRWSPGTVLYYDTLSSFPALIYKKYIKRRSALLIHYHEYVSEKEYRHGMILSRWLHRWEKRSYRGADWISQTNLDRAALFKKGMAAYTLPEVHGLPNYPPASWQSAIRQRPTLQLPVKIVYVGALSLDTMYTREFAQWVIGQSGKVIWDIYSDNMTPEAGSWLASLGNEWVRFREGVNYYSLPGLLGGYDIGVILYNGHIPNYIYNAPNKLFEYLDCGLDVWFPRVMKGIYPYITEETYPKVLALDPGDLSEWDLATAIDRKRLRYAPPAYYAENVFGELLSKIR